MGDVLMPQVLLVEPDAKHREYVSSLLLQCSYQG
jgi:hypothetical protein